MGLSEAAHIREARPEDHDDVAAMTGDTWPDRDVADYLPRVFPEWIEPGERPKRTVVAEIDGQAVAIAQGVMLSDYEAWGQGLRVHPEYRRRGLTHAITADLFDWAHDQGAAVFRVMVFAWNIAALGQARSAGYQPICSVRFVRLRPTTAAPAREVLATADRPWLPEPVSAEVSHDPADAWTAFRESDAAGILGGLALSLDESWALCELTPAALERAAAETAVIAVHTASDAGAMSFRSRTFERSDDDGEARTIAEYGVAVWDDLAAGAALLDAIAADAASIGADRARAVVPETPRHVSDAALLRAEVHDYPDFVLGADLTGVDRLSRR